MDSKVPRRQLTRRGAIRLMTAVVGAAGLGRPFISQANTGAGIRIGLSVAQDPANAANARHVRFGADWAVRQRGGKVLGQTVQVLVIDEPDGASLRASARDLIQGQRVAGLIGGSSTEAGMTLKALAAEAGVPVIIHSAIADDITLRDTNPWTFRVPASATAQFMALCPYVAEVGKRWFVLTGSDRTSHASGVLSAPMIGDVGGLEVGRAGITPGVTDHRALIEAIRAAKPDVVLSGLQGAEAMTFLKAWHAAGMKDRIPYAQIGLSDTDLWALGGQVATGIYVKTYHYKSMKNPPAVKAFVAAFGRQYPGEVPGTAAFQAQAAMESLLSAVERAGGAEPGRVRDGLEQFAQPFGDITLRYRAGDRQMMHRLPILETKTIVRTRHDFWDIEGHAPEAASDLEAFYADAVRRAGRS